VTDSAFDPVGEEGDARPLTGIGLGDYHENSKVNAVGAVGHEPIERHRHVCDRLCHRKALLRHWFFEKRSA
jgi:hypothetical protein